MKYDIYLNNVKTSKEIPVSWDQVTFRKFLKLGECGQDNIKVLSLFTDVPYETLVKCRFPDLEKAIATLSFLREQPVPIIPKEILGYQIPKDLGLEQVQMYIDLKNYVNETKDLQPLEKLSKYPLYCAVYSCKDNYSFQRAEELCETFFEAPCTEVLGIGNFTLLRLTALNLAINPTSRKPLGLKMRLKLVLTSWPRTLAVIQRWFTWRKKPVEAIKNY